MSVAAAGIAKKYLREQFGTETYGYLAQVGHTPHQVDGAAGDLALPGTQHLLQSVA